MTQPASPGAGMRPGGPPGAMPGGGRPSLRKATTVFSIREFRVLFGSQLAAMLGMQMMMIARGVLAWELTGSFGITGLLGLSFGIPMLCLSLVGGATADRIDKRKLIMLTQLGNGTLALTTGLLVATDVITVPLLFMIGLVQGTLFAFMMPPRQALLREFVPEGQLMNAVALSSAAQSATTIIGPALAGGVIALWDIQAAYFVMATMGAIAFTMYFQLPPSRSHLLEAGVQRKSVLSDMGAGIRYVTGTPALRLLMLMAFIPALFAMPYQMLLPGYADTVLGNQDVYPIIMTTAGIGSFFGSLTVASLSGFRRKPLLQVMFGTGIAVGLISLGIGGALFGTPAALVAAVLIGACMLGFQTINNTLIMTTAEPQMLGRTMSIMMMTMSAIPLMSYPMGLIADAVGATNLFVTLGLGIVTALALMGFTNPGYLFGKTPELGQARGPGVPQGRAAPGAADVAGGGQ